MAEVQTKALFTAQRQAMMLHYPSWSFIAETEMQAFFYGIAEEADLVSLGEINKMTHVLHFVDEEASGWSALRMKWAALRWTSASMILILPK